MPFDEEDLVDVRIPGHARRAVRHRPQNREEVPNNAVASGDSGGLVFYVTSTGNRVAVGTVSAGTNTVLCFPRAGDILNAFGGLFLNGVQGDDP